MKRRMPVRPTHAKPRLLSPLLVVLCGLLPCAAPDTATADDWPSYRSDIVRSGVTTETLPNALSLQWTYTSTHPPKPAWPTPGEEMPRMHTDSVFHVAAADGRVFFGSSVTNEVCAIDTASGNVAWTFFTQGPVRFAPTVQNNRVYVGSDDGRVYCLAADTGSLLWKYRPGPSDEKVIGNGRLISLWPVRTGVLVDQGVAYCAAGVFPYEGLYICALDAEDGSVIWKNDTMGDRAHELSYGGMTPQGYLLASQDVLYVPSGRAMPAAFNRQTGQFLFWASPGGKRGGTWTLLNDNQLIAGVDFSGTPHKVAYDAQTGRSKGDVFAWFPGRDMVIKDNMAYILALQGIYALDRDTHAEAVRQVEASAQKRKALGQELAALRKNAKKATGAEAGKINRRIAEITNVTRLCALEEKRLQNSCYAWHLPVEEFGSLILGGDTLFAGGHEQVIGVDARTGLKVWESKVSGNAGGLAAANGCLIASTDRGAIHCFAPPKRQVPPTRIEAALNPNPFAGTAEEESYRTTARQIVSETKITKGYGLLLDDNVAQLAYELSQITDLQIVGLEKDPDKLRAARGKLKSAHLLGSRIVIEPWDIDDLPPYFANLIVSHETRAASTANGTSEALHHLLTPAGGTLLTYARNENGDLRCKTLERPALAGAGSWTQQYGNPQNTACSADEMAKGPLGVLWFGEPGPLAMVERHAKAQSPLAMDGRLFIQGEEVIFAVDAYNGTLLWERHIPGAVRARADVDGGNLALSDNALYVAAYDKCLRLDPATGQTVRVYNLPATGAGSYRWGCVFICDNILFGVRAAPLKQPYAAELNAKHANPNDATLWAYKRANSKWFPMANYPAWENYSEEKGAVTDRMMVGDMVFACDPDTAKVLWTCPGRRIANLTVSIGDGKVFFAESEIANDQRQRALQERHKLIQEGTYQATEAMSKAATYEPTDVRLAVALDAKTGRKLWERPIDFTGCCGDAMGSAYQDDVLLFFGCVGNHDAYRFRENQLAFRRIVALSASVGHVLWSRPLDYRTRPVVMGQKIIIEPRACDLRTGAIQTRRDPVTGKQVPWEFLRPGHTCAITSASANTLFYRSSSTAIYDLARDAGVALFGGIRPGCWINMIPASGVVLVPEASVGCTCSFPLRCSFALAHKPDRPQPWTVFIKHTELDPKGRVIPDTFDKPVRHLAINFGAPADMKDNDGTLWLAYPNPRTVYSQNHFSNYGIKFDLAETILEGGEYFCRDFKGLTIEGTDKPWLFTSGCLGLRRCEIPLLDEQSDGKHAVYTIRLGFKAPAGSASRQRRCDIKLQGQTVAHDFDVAPGQDRALIREFTDVTVNGSLVLELVPHATQPGADQAPLINAIEIIRQDT